MNTLKYKIIAVILILITTYIFYTNWKIKSLENDLQKTKIAYDISEQNNKAYSDKLNAKDDSIRKYYVFVKDLNKLS